MTFKKAKGSKTGFYRQVNPKYQFGFFFEPVSTVCLSYISMLLESRGALFFSQIILSSQMLLSIFMGKAS